MIKDERLNVTVDFLWDRGEPRRQQKIEKILQKFESSNLHDPAIRTQIAKELAEII